MNAPFDTRTSTRTDGGKMLQMKLGLPSLPRQCLGPRNRIEFSEVRPVRPRGTPDIEILLERILVLRHELGLVT
jgi:hypothetical protein